MKRSLFLLSLIGICLSLALGELVLHIVDATNLNPTTKELYEFRCYAKGTDYWIRLKPNASCLLRSSKQAFPDELIQTNTLGLRNKAITIPKPKDTIRILVLGDSFTFGMGVSETASFPRLLEQHLKQANDPSKEIEVINAGLPTADISYYYLFLKNTAPKLEPDIIIIGYYVYNDTSDEELRPIWTTVDAQGLPLTTDSETAYVDAKGILYSKTIPLFFRYPILRYSKIIVLVSRVYTMLTMKQTNKVSLIPKELCFYKPSCHTQDGTKERAKKLFSAMKELDAVRGKPFIVTLIPADFQINDKARLKFDIPVALSPAEKQYPNQELTSMLKDLQIPSVDLLPILEGQKDSPAYFEKDIHWNETGHAIAAQALYERVLPYIKTP